MTLAKRQLILCCDGTWNIPESDSPTHIGRIAKLASLPTQGAQPERIVYYVRGVGGRYALDRFVGGAIGEGLEANVKDAYLFLATNYQADDEIFIFGFSRGAFTARCVAGMVDTIGLLKPQHTNRLGRAYRQYRRTLRIDEPELKRDMTKSVAIRFLGVFDTVGALGIPIGGVDKSHEFRNNLPPQCVRTARHALAINERRKNFTPTVWQVREDTPSAAHTGLSNDPKMTEDVDIVQRWFAGVHSDIGGGYAITDDPEIASGSYFTLKWMLSEARECGFVIDPDETEKMLRTLDRNHVRAGEVKDPDGMSQKFELHDSMRILYLLANIHRRFFGALKSGDSSAVRHIVDSGAACQEIDLSPWQAYMADPKCKFIATEERDEPLLEFVIRRRTNIFQRGFRAVKIAKHPELKKKAKSVLDETGTSDTNLVDRLTAHTDAPSHRGKTWLRAVAMLLSLIVLLILWQLLSAAVVELGGPDLSIPPDAGLTTSVLLGIGCAGLLLAVGYGIYVMYVSRYP